MNASLRGHYQSALERIRQASEKVESLGSIVGRSKVQDQNYRSALNDLAAGEHIKNEMERAYKV